MHVAHSFRLREPWQREVLEDCVRWSRGFHKPTGLEPGQQLWIVVSGAPEGVTASVNGTPLELADPERPGQFDVTPLLGDSNQIVLQQPNCGDADGAASGDFPLDVRLAIVEP